MHVQSPVLGLVRLARPALNRGLDRATWTLVRDDDHGVTLGPEARDEERGQPLRLPVVSSSGRYLTGFVPVDDHEGPVDQTTVEQLVLLDTSTGATADVGVRFCQGRNDAVVVAYSPDDTTLALVRSTYHQREWTLRLAMQPSGSSVAERQRTFPGSRMVFPTMDYPLQWSTDGRRIALQLREPGGILDSTIVLDVDTLETVARFPGTRPMGSVSWSSDSDALAVLDVDEPHIPHVSDGRLQKVRWLEGDRGDPPRQPMILGLLHGDRALIVRQTRQRMRLQNVDLRSGEGETTLNLPLTDWDWPVRPAVSRAWDAFLS